MKRIDAVREARNALADGQHLNSLPEMRQAICMANRLLNAVIASYDALHTACECPQAETKTEGK